MSRIGVSVIGASNRSSMIFRHLKDHPEEGFIAGVYDLIPAKARCVLDHHGLKDARVYESLAQAVGDGQAQAAFVAPTDCAHAECAIAALEAGRHVFCEKPMALTIEDCDAIIRAAQGARGILYVGMNLRHSPVHAALHELLAGGKLGKLLTIEANEYYYDGKTYFRRWNRLRKFGGGMWLTKACHDFDLLNWMAGGRARKVLACSSLSYYKPQAGAGTHCRACPIASTCPDYFDIQTRKSWLVTQLAALTEQASGVAQDICLYNSDKDTFDNGIAVVEYDNDVRATYTVNVVSARDTRQMRLMGTEGAAEGDMATGMVTYWRRHTKETTVQDVREKMKSGHGGSDGSIMADFFRCCRTGDRPKSSWREGRACVQVGLAATASCDTGQAVTITD